MNDNPNQTCPCCPNHCYSDALQCGKGRTYFSENREPFQAQDEAAGKRSIPRHARHEECRERRDRRSRREQTPERFFPSGQPFSPEEQLFEQFRACTHALHHPGNGKSGQLRILSVLSANSPITQRQLMDILDVRSGSLSEILGKMETEGYITRTPNKQDKRGVDVTLTPAGLEAAAQMQVHRGNAVQDFFSCLSQEEKEQLSLLLEKLLEDWRSKKGMDGGRDYGRHERGSREHGSRERRSREQGRAEERGREPYGRQRDTGEHGNRR